MLAAFLYPLAACAVGGALVAAPFVLVLWQAAYAGAWIERDGGWE